jgi:hypothetical protein
MPARPVVETETIAVPITAGGAGVGDDAEADADGDAVASPARLGVTADKKRKAEKKKNLKRL